MARVFEIAFNLAAQIGSSFNSTFASAAGQMRNLQTNASRLRAGLRELESAQRTGQISASEYATQQQRLAEQLARTERAQRNLSSSMRIQQNVGNVKDKAAGVMTTAAVGVAAFAVPIMSAIEYDTAMAGVAKQVDGARDDAGQLTSVYYDMSQQIMAASKSMMIMPDVMAKSFVMAAKSGVKGAENIEAFAKMGVMLGTAFEMPAEEVTEQFAKIGSAIGINLETAEGIEKLRSLADTVNYLDDQTNASGADIIDVLKRTAGTATSLLPTLSNTTLAGMSTAMLQMGETSETTGTALNALFTKIAAAPTQGKPFKDALAQIGMSAEELQNGALNDAEGTIMSLFEKIGTLDGAQKNNVLAELFGAEYIGKLSKISGNYDAFVDIMKKGNSEAAKGSVAKEFAIQAETVARKLDGVKVSASHTAIYMGQILLPAVMEVTQRIMEISSRFSEWSAKNPELTSLIVKTAAGAAVLALVVATTAFAFSSVILPLMTFGRWMFMARVATDGMVLSSRASAIWSGICATATTAWTAAQWLWNAALTANPIGLVIMGIAALIAIGYLLYKNWDLITQKVNETGESISLAFSSAWQSVVNGASSMCQGVDIWLQGAYVMIVEFASSAYNAIAEFATGAYAAVVNFAMAIPGYLAYALGLYIGFLLSLPSRIYQFTQTTFIALVEGTVNIYNAIVAWGSMTYQALTNWLPMAWESFRTGMESLVTLSISGAINVYYGITGWLSNAITTVVDLFFSFPGMVANALATFLIDATQWAMNVYNGIVTWFLQIPDAIAGAFNQASSYMDDLFNKIGNFSSKIGIEFSAGMQAGSGVSIASNASGGIYGKGSFLTTFAEDSAEAAIPLDGSPRALSLWAQAGSILGVMPQVRQMQQVGQLPQMAQLPQVAKLSQLAIPQINIPESPQITHNIQLDQPQDNEPVGFIAMLKSLAQGTVNNTNNINNSSGKSIIQFESKPTIIIQGNPNPGQVEKEIGNANQSLIQQISEIMNNERRLSYE